MTWLLLGISRSLAFPRNCRSSGEVYQQICLSLY
jgi:hypothetical protein